MNIKVLLCTLTLILLVFVALYLDMGHINVGKYDKIAHLTAFFIGVSVLNIIFIILFDRKWIPHYILIMVILGGIASTLYEKLQLLTSDRTCDPLDWLCNVAGLGLALLVLFAIDIKFFKKSEE